MNPLMQSMGVLNQPASQIKQMMNLIRMSRNPQQIVMQAAKQNPSIGAALQMCNGRNPKDVFYEQCQKMGVNPDDILSQLR